ncbi:MAG: alpha/beta fold hydrolase [Rubrobacteraceae bacterium]
MANTTEGVLTRAGCPIHYWLSGPENAPPVVFSHGATMDHRMFDAQVPAVAGKYRAITWDMRGHGRSRPLGDIGEGLLMSDLVEDLVALMDHLEYERVSLVGQSLGGHLAQDVVFYHPERVGALVTVGSSCSTLKQPRLDRFALRLSPVAFKLWPESGLRKRIANNTAVTPEVQAYAYEATRQLTKEDFMKVWNAVTNLLHHEPEYRIEHPLLITHGDQDEAGNIQKISPKWAERDPNSRYVVIPAAGHNANQDNPDFFYRLLLEFLEEHAPVVDVDRAKTEGR